MAPIPKKLNNLKEILTTTKISIFADDIDIVTLNLSNHNRNVISSQNCIYHSVGYTAVNFLVNLRPKFTTRLWIHNLHNRSHRSFENRDASIGDRTKKSLLGNIKINFLR